MPVLKINDLRRKIFSTARESAKSGYFRREKRCHFRVWHDALIFACPGVFELKVEPNWITETYLCDSAVEQRLAEIESWLWHHDAMHRLDWLSGHRHRWREPRRPELLDQIARRELREANFDSSEVDPAAPERRTRFSLRRRRPMLPIAIGSTIFRRNDPPAATRHRRERS